MDPETQEAPAVDTGQGAPASETTSAEAELTQSPEPGVQPDSEGSDEAQPSGQDFIAPYLEGVDDQHREVVAEVLEKYRKDSDANVTKKFEQLNAYQQYAPEPHLLETPVAIYENLLERPVDTLEWVIQRFQDEAGVDLKSQLIERLGLEGAQASKEPSSEADTAPDDPDRPLTRAEFEKLQEEQRQQAAAERQRQQQIQTVEGWLSEAVQKYGLDISDDDVVLKEAVLKQAATLMPKLKRQYGQDAGRVAVETAVEAFGNRFGQRPSAPSSDPSPEPKVADGGMPPAPEEPSLDSAEDRKKFMLSRLGLTQE